MDINDQPYDEAEDIESASSHPSFDEMDDNEFPEDDLDGDLGSFEESPTLHNSKHGLDDMDDHMDTDEGLADDYDERQLAASHNAPIPANAREISDLFSYIDVYVPREIEMPVKLEPFIPEYMPAVGDVDPFLKVPRPDGKLDNVGLFFSDEPSLDPSDPTVLELELRTSLGGSSQSSAKRTIVPTPAAIQNWIDNVERLHKEQPVAQVSYSKPMPDIDDLMQIWPAEFEEILKTSTLPGPDIELSLSEYLEVVATLLDVPFERGQEREVLHLLFTLFHEVNTNEHYVAQGNQ
ncbi:Intraflagellar transport complex B protein 46 [Carpediemonas membranifera]|uniref:Intraflagellar transport complex B protein 46 n=1 Tax=Carpediemonas membranifera TaxID=201153 RepID=A0A8J6BDN0_9EUKA|nr:Intraflagellar transport complex B protein 46 [Carpediemonas membranifera]|eukprot:KAG9395307.1 Intraflagellar transport complex B protein 46 [Carpediemonas membranifera]